MNMQNATPYEDALRALHELASSGQTREALDQIVDSVTGRLRGIFRQDGNHSWYVVGDYYWTQGQIEHAIVAFRRSLRAWQGDTQAMWALGNCYTEQNKPRLAEHYFRRALRLERANASIRFNLGNVLFDQGKFEDAVREYKLAAKSSKDLAKVAQKNILLAERKLTNSRRPP